MRISVNLKYGVDIKMNINKSLYHCSSCGNSGKSHLEKKQKSIKFEYCYSPHLGLVNLLDIIVALYLCDDEPRV